MLRLCFLTSAVYAVAPGGDEGLPGLDQEFVMGLMEGVLDGEGSDFALCLVNGVLPPVQEGGLALQDIKAGIKARNLSEIATGLAAVGQAIKDSHQVGAQCSGAESDEHHIKDITKNIKGVQDLIHHVRDDIAKDGDDLIGKEFEMTMQALAKKDDGGFGQHLGMLLHRIFIEPKFPNEQQPHSAALTEEQPSQMLPPWMNSEFALGFIEGLLDDQGMDFATCVVSGIFPVVQYAPAALNDFKMGIKTRNLTLISEGIQEVSNTMQAVHALGAQCKDAKVDASTVIAVLKSVHGVKGWLEHIKGDFDNNTASIMQEANATMESYKKKSYGSFGQHLGSLLHRTFVGPFPNEGAVVV